MAQFPRDEDSVLGLAQEMIDSFAANRSTYPAPPISVEEIKAATDECDEARDAAQAARAARDAAQAARAALDAALRRKDAAFDTLEERMKKDIRYAENTGQTTIMDS